MRTTLAIDDDVLEAARAMAHMQGRSIGEVMSSLARASLQPAITRTHRGDVPLIPTRDPDAVVTIEFVNALRDEGA